MIGKAHFGRTHAVRGWGYLSTRFLHVGYLPLIPTGSVFVHEDGTEQPVSFSLRSTALAWTWTAAAVALLTGLVAIDVQPAAALPLIVAAATTLLFLRAPWLRNASWEQAMVLADTVDARPIQRVKIALAFDKITPDKASKGIERLTKLIEPSDDERSALQAEAVDLLVEAHERERAERLARDREEFESRTQRRLPERPPVKSKKTPVARPVRTTSLQAVKFACPHCDKTSKVPAKHAGRKGRCRHCHGKLRVPHPYRAPEWQLKTALV